MVLNHNYPESGGLPLPNSSWAIPAMTVAVIALAVAVALA